MGVISKIMPSPAHSSPDYRYFGRMHCRKIPLLFIILSSLSKSADAFSLTTLRSVRPSLRSSFNCHQPRRTKRRLDPLLALNAASRDLDASENNLNSSERPRATTATDLLSNKSVRDNPTSMIKGYDPAEGIPESVNVGDPQVKVQEKERSVTSILRELAAIQQKGPQKYCILGTRHCSYLHQQIIELL